MRLDEVRQARILKLRRTTALNLAGIAAEVGTGRSSVQRVVESAGLGDMGRRNKTKTKKSRPPQTTNVHLDAATAAVRFRRRLYCRGARVRGLAFELTEDECEELFTSLCHYCGTPPTMGKVYVRQRDKQAVAQNGIDRVDNSVGYIRSNCVSCCSHCNFAKRDMGIGEFEAWLDRIALCRAKKTSEANGQDVAGLVLFRGEVPTEKRLVAS